MIATLRRAVYGVATMATMAGVMLVAAPSANAEPVPPEPGLALCKILAQQGGGFAGDVTIPRRGVDVRISPSGPTGVAMRVTGKNTATGETREEALYFPPGVPPAAQTVQFGNAYAKGWSTWSVSIEPAGNVEVLYGIEFWSGACGGDFNATVSGSSEISFEAAKAKANAERMKLEKEENAYCHAYESWNSGGWGPYLYLHYDNLDCIRR